MFDVGFAELFLLALVGLLVLGPERLPKVAHTIGGLIRQARQSWMMMRRTIESELETARLAEPVKEVRDSIESMGREISDLPKKVSDAINPASEKPADEQPLEEPPEDAEEPKDGRSAE
jgi:sec-independent protein translocase protein TatB